MDFRLLLLHPLPPVRGAHTGREGGTGGEGRERKCGGREGREGGLLSSTGPKTGSGRADNVAPFRTILHMQTVQTCNSLLQHALHLSLPPHLPPVAKQWQHIPFLLLDERVLRQQSLQVCIWNDIRKHFFGHPIKKLYIIYIYYINIIYILYNSILKNVLYLSYIS
jgi:hypothetical protein